MNDITYNCGIISNGDYCQWLRDGQSYEPTMRRTRGGFDSAAEADRVGCEDFAGEIDDGYHLIVFYYDCNGGFKIS